MPIRSEEAAWSRRNDRMLTAHEDTTVDCSLCHGTKRFALQLRSAVTKNSAHGDASAQIGIPASHGGLKMSTVPTMAPMSRHAVANPVVKKDQGAAADHIVMLNVMDASGKPGALRANWTHWTGAAWIRGPA